VLQAERVGLEADRRPVEVLVAGVALIADFAGALFHEAERLLIVADLHLEKGSAFAERRVFLPPYDTAATLARLAALVARYRPRAVAALGDSFHDRRAGGRMGPSDRASLVALQAGRDWIWIAGNHDPDVPADLGETVAEWRLGGLLLRHEPQADAAPGEIAGHLHPVARVVSQSGSVRRRCFVGDGRRCVMPAFGAYAGGLNIRDRAFAPLLSGRARAHVLGRAAVYAVDAERCIGD
jgi:DNA ligase-associated metallophosphoesterase